MKTAPAFSVGAWLKNNQASLLVLLAAALLFAGFRFSLREPPAPQLQAGDYAEYEKGTVVSVLSDSTFADEASDGGYRGEQQLLVDVTSGQYKGQPHRTFSNGKFISGYSDHYPTFIELKK